MKKVLVAVLAVSALTMGGIVLHTPSKMAVFVGPDPVGLSSGANQVAVFVGPDPVVDTATQSNA